MAVAGLGHRLVRAAWDVALPQQCLACGRFGAALHDACLRALPQAGGPRCIVCWRPGPGTWCERCAGGGPDAPAFDGLRAPFRFEDDARRAVIEAKFRGVSALLSPLARDAAALVPPEWTPAAVTPIPLRPARYRRRGFNQAEVIARHVAAGLGIPAETRLLRRVRDAPPQASMPAARRRENVRGVFAASRQPPARVLLVDDVTTTGATLSEAAATLKAAGAERVYALALAREDEDWARVARRGHAGEPRT